MSATSSHDAAPSHNIIAQWSFAVPAGSKLPDATGRFNGVADGVSAAENDAAWHFPGDAAHVRVTHDPALDLVDGYTLEAVVRLDRIGNPRNKVGVQAILEKHIGKGGWLFVVEGEGRLHYWMETPDGRVEDTSTVALEPNRWYHVAMTWDGAKTVFYVDGAPAGEKAFAGPLGRCPQDLYLGNDDTKDWSWWGDIAEITITSGALSADEIAKNAAAARKGK
jgi:hypothetical protein